MGRHSLLRQAQWQAGQLSIPAQMRDVPLLLLLQPRDVLVDRQSVALQLRCTCWLNVWLRRWRLQRLVLFGEVLGWNWWGAAAEAETPSLSALS